MIHGRSKQRRMRIVVKNITSENNRDSLFFLRWNERQLLPRAINFYYRLCKKRRKKKRKLLNNDAATCDEFLTDKIASGNYDNYECQYKFCCLHAKPRALRKKLLRVPKRVAESHASHTKYTVI